MPLPGRPWCQFHDPQAAELRRATSAKGGHARSNQARAKKAMPEALTAAELASWLSLLFRQTIERQIEPRVATAAATVARTLLEARADGELEQRLAVLEAELRLVRRSA